MKFTNSTCRDFLWRGKERCWDTSSGILYSALLVNGYEKSVRGERVDVLLDFMVAVYRTYPALVDCRQGWIGGRFYFHRGI